jgi:hypothetical protein
MNYIPVLVCSSDKIKTWFRYQDKHIMFVSPPHKFPNDIYTHHYLDDEIPGENRTWRDLVLNGQNNPNLDMARAYLLYRPKIDPDIYRDFYNKFKNRFYIFSSGWGIVRAEFKIPAYNIADITDSAFPNMLNHLKDDYVKSYRDSEVILFAGSAYVAPFRAMTQSIPYRKKTIVRYCEKTPNEKEALYKNPNKGDFYYLDYKTNNPRNWHYRAAREFMRKIQK